MSYGLTDAGFNPKTAAVIEEELVDAITAIPGFEDIPTDGSSAWGNLISILAEREALLWALLLAIWWSLSRATATAQSLDNALANIGKSRNLERSSTVFLTLYNRTSNTPVTVEFESQARQPATGVIWETLEDAEIPALETLHSSLDIDAIEWQPGGATRATFNGSPDLSSVAVGDLITLSNCSNSSNDGEYTITAIDIESFWVEYTNENRTDDTDDEASDTAAIADIDDVEASVIVPAQSLNAGAFEASIGSITEIVTGVSGWDAVSNETAALVGRAQEEDPEVKLRVADELTIAQGSTLDAVKAQLRKVAGYRYVTGIENRTDEVVDGNEPHSYRFTMVGGLDQDIINVIGKYKAAGMETNGNVSGTYTDPEGVPVTIRFDRADEIIPFLIIMLTVNASYPAGADDLIKAAIEAIEFEAGEDLYSYRIVQAVANTGIPGIEEIIVYQGLTEDPDTSATIPIAADEVINIALDRITVVS